MSGNVLSTYKSSLAGDYQKSAIVNGVTSWINADYAIWFVDDTDFWVVGKLKERGMDLSFMKAKSKSVCPSAIDSTTWEC